MKHPLQEGRKLPGQNTPARPTAQDPWRASGWGTGWWRVTCGRGRGSVCIHSGVPGPRSPQEEPRGLGLQGPKGNSGSLDGSVWPPKLRGKGRHCVSWETLQKVPPGSYLPAQVLGRHSNLPEEVGQTWGEPPSQAAPSPVSRRVGVGVASRAQAQARAAPQDSPGHRNTEPVGSGVATVLCNGDQVSAVFSRVHVS